MNKLLQLCIPESRLLKWIQILILFLFLPAFGPLNRGWYVQYGWSGNGGYFRVVGLRLLVWYKAPEDVEYLFRLGQTSFIGKKEAKKAGSAGWKHIA